MALSSTDIRRITRKAKKNSLEVEDLLEVATIGSAQDATLLQKLKSEHGWPLQSGEGKNRVVPFGAWSDAICHFLEKQHEGLIQYAAAEPDSVTFCVGVLEAVKTVESVEAMLTIASSVESSSSSSHDKLLKIVSGLNLLVSFKDAPSLEPSLSEKARNFIHALLPQCKSQQSRALCVCALRGVGDSASIEIIKALPPFVDAWADLEKSACRQIQTRLRASENA